MAILISKGEYTDTLLPICNLCTTSRCVHSRFCCLRERRPSSPLRRFVGHILDEVKPALEAYHGFVDGNLTTKIVCSLEIVKQWIHKWPQLVEWVIARLALGDVQAAVIEVKEAKDEGETIPFENAGEGGRSKRPFH